MSSIALALICVLISVPMCISPKNSPFFPLSFHSLSRRTLNDALRFFDRNQPNCCNPSHTKPLCISIIVFTILELITFGAVFPIGLFFIAIANVSATDTEGNTYTVPLGPRAYITYIGLSIVLGAIWPIVSLILSIVQMCFTDSLMSMGQSRIFITPSSSQITVISMPQQQQGMPPMMMMGSGYSNAPNIYQMAQHATQLPPSNPGYGYPQPPPGMMHPYHPQQQQGYPSNYPPPQQGQDGGYPMNNYPQQPMVTSGGPGMMPTPPAYNTVGDPSNNNGGNPYSKN